MEALEIKKGIKISNRKSSWRLYEWLSGHQNQWTNKDIHEKRVDVDRLKYTKGC